jgi:hypothetical protein
MSDHAPVAPAGSEPLTPTPLPGLVGPAVVDFLVRYCRLRQASGAFGYNDQVRESQFIYGDPAFDTLLEDVAPTASEFVGTRLLPTYSYVRLYERGQELRPHRDRPACEFSVTVHLGSSEPVNWPMWCRIGKGEPVAVHQSPGDGLLYEGPRTLHWRDPFAGEWHLQAFLHYVAADGPHCDQALDGRPALGLPRRQAG